MTTVTEHDAIVIGAGPAGSTVARGLAARGPAVLLLDRARLARHLRLEKKNHWHVDHLRAVARLRGAAGFLESGECRLIQRLLELPGEGVPGPGFGATDCPAC